MSKSIVAVITAITVSAVIIFSVVAGVKRLICSWQRLPEQAIATMNEHKEDRGAQ